MPGQTQVQLPPALLCAQLFQQVSPGGFSIDAGLGAPPGQSARIIIADHPTSSGCGRFTARFVVGNGSDPIDLALSPHDTILVSVFFDQSTHDVTGTLEDVTTGVSAASGTGPGTPIYATAHVMTGFTSFTAPARQYQVYAFTSSAATTYSGARGTLTGPWSTGQTVMTSNGEQSGTVEVSNPVLWEGGRNFGTYIRSA